MLALIFAVLCHFPPFYDCFEKQDIRFKGRKVWHTDGKESHQKDFKCVLCFRATSSRD